MKTIRIPLPVPTKDDARRSIEKTADMARLLRKQSVSARRKVGRGLVRLGHKLAAVSHSRTA